MIHVHIDSKERNPVSHAAPIRDRAVVSTNNHGVPTILNPAPAAPLPETIYPLCDYFTPNETEAMPIGMDHHVNKVRIVE